MHDCGLALQDVFAALVLDLEIHLGDAPSLGIRRHRRLGRDRIADINGLGEIPALVQEDAAGPRHVHGHEGMQQPGDDAALSDQAAEPSLACELLVEMERVLVSGNLGVALDHSLCHAQLALGLLSYCDHLSGPYPLVFDASVCFNQYTGGKYRL